MLNSLKKEECRVFTENGGVTLATTGSACLDLFSAAGGLRHEKEEEILSRFVRAFTENRSLAMKLLFYARDVRGGLGERRFFKVILKWLAKNEPETVRRNLDRISEYGRYDDLLVLMGTPLEREMLFLIRRQLSKDMEAMEQGAPVSLLAKWLPSVNTSNKKAVCQAKRIARALSMNDRAYRKQLVQLRAYIRILENDLRTGNYTFDYEQQPSKALFKYKKAFWRNDEERYLEFLSRASSGRAVLHSDTLYPYELVDPYLSALWHNQCFMRPISEQEKQTLNATWAALPDYGGEEDVLAVVDTSGSMYTGTLPKPASVALSLGLYFAERNKGAFRNHFIEFSKSPRLIELKGESFADRLRYAASFNEVANTDLEAVFDLILQTAVKNGLSQDRLPSKLIIISDMEFDRCVTRGELTHFENAKKNYAACGYRLPKIVFWNVANRHGHTPVSKNEQGVLLVSGCTPRLFETVALGSTEKMTPYAMMLEVLGSKRYEPIVA
ncbi:MAG: DUF2828 family protein [Clostridia bacterium]|nr:DUF2828 family protein [Clostridia bacterium]